MHIYLDWILTGKVQTSTKFDYAFLPTWHYVKRNILTAQSERPRPSKESTCGNEVFGFSRSTSAHAANFDLIQSDIVHNQL